MRPSSIYFSEVQTRRLERGRERAELAIETALRICDEIAPSDDQAADLADAVAAFRARQFAIAVDLAEAAFERQRNAPQKSASPLEMTRTLAEMRTLFAELRVA